MMFILILIPGARCQGIGVELICLTETMCFVKFSQIIKNWNSLHIFFLIRNCK